MNDKLSVVRPEAGAVAMREPDDEQEPMDLLRMAVRQGMTDPAALERLMTVRKQLRDERAKYAFDAALSAFQGDCPIIVKRKFGAKNAYRFAPLDHIISEVRGLLRAHGFSFSITAVIDSGWCLAQCKIKHRGGHFDVSEFKVPIDTKNPMMTEPQRYGGAMTFSKRYAFCNGFGILTADEDTDAQSQTPKPVGPSVAPADLLKEAKAALWQLLGPVRGIAASWVIAEEWMGKKRILAAGRKVSTLTLEEINDAIAKAEMALTERGE